MYSAEFQPRKRGRSSFVRTKDAKQQRHYGEEHVECAEHSERDEKVRGQCHRDLKALHIGTLFKGTETDEVPFSYSFNLRTGLHLESREVCDHPLVRLDRFPDSKEAQGLALARFHGELK